MADELSQKLAKRDKVKGLRRLREFKHKRVLGR
jgi:hypothetical protein